MPLMAPEMAPRDHETLIDFDWPKNKKTSKSAGFRGFDFV
jgi:hypothetical protein